MIAARTSYDPTTTTAPADLVVFTLTCGGERFGLPIANVVSVFTLGALTPVPLAPREIVGLINLRGTIVTAISLRRRLGLPAEASLHEALAVGLQHNGENYALVVDEVGDVLDMAQQSALPLPAHVDPFRGGLTRQAFRLADGVLPVFDLAALLDTIPHDDVRTNNIRGTRVLS